NVLPEIDTRRKGRSRARHLWRCRQIGHLFTAFCDGFSVGAEPFFFAFSKNEHAQRTYAKIMEYFVILMVVGMVALTTNLSWLKSFIQGNELQPDVYWPGLKIVPLLLFNYVLLGIYMNLSVWYKLTDQTRYGLYISV